MAGYWVVKVRVTDSEAYGEYAKRVPPVVQRYGGRVLVRGGAAATMEGEDFPRNVVVEFESYDQALACYNDPEYQEAKSYQDGAADRMFAIVEGV
jgi:uncharacterized protein (DUF1330 family)